MATTTPTLHVWARDYGALVAVVSAAIDESVHRSGQRVRIMLDGVTYGRDDVCEVLFAESEADDYGTYYGETPDGVWCVCV